MKSKMGSKVFVSVLGLIIAFLLALTGCSKYGYNLADGFDKSDSAASNITVDTTMSRPDFSMLSKARIFPGTVGANETRLKDTVVTLDLNYKYPSSKLRISVEPQPQFSIGLYAPPGESIEIDVPDGINDLTAQIGEWTDDLSNRTPRQREPVIFTRKKLFPGKNYIRGLFGGTMYINTTRSWEQTVALHISGAVKEPDFIIGVTDPNIWKQEIAKSTVPWFELRGKRIIFSLPTSYVQKRIITDPEALVEFWDNTIESDYNEWAGLSDNPSDPIDQNPSLPWRAVLDIDPSIGYGHSGFPVVFQMDDYWFGTSTDLNVIKSGVPWGVLHEIGHNWQQSGYWSWSALGETTNNLFSFKYSNRLGLPINQARDDNSFFDTAMAYIARPGGKSFDTYFANDPFSKMVPFIQLFEKYGYGLMGYLYSSARRAVRQSYSDQDKRDFVYERVCEYTQKEFKPYFDAWGIPVSSVSYNKMTALYPPLDVDVWNFDPVTHTGGNKSIIVNTSVTDNTTWTITDFDSQEPTGETAPNGLATSVIDGNINTFWHSQWSAASPSYPHYITFDMLKKLTFNGLYFIGRYPNSGQRVKDFRVFVSDDGTNFTQLRTNITELANNGNRQDVIFNTPVMTRYIKVIFDNSWSSPTYAAMAEIGGF